MCMSVRGIARRFRGVGGPFRVRNTFAGPLPLPFPLPIPSLRARLSDIARQEFSFSMNECIYGWTAAFEQTWSRVRVRVRLNPDTGITQQTMATLRQTWENGIETTWGNRRAIGRAGEIACPLRFDVVWVTGGEHHTVRVRTGPAGTNMTTWDTSDSGAVSAHEFGHMLGHPDEYTDSACPNRSPVSTGTVMDNNSNTVPDRLLQRFANNVGSGVVAIP